MNNFKFDTVSEFDKHISDSITGYSILHNLIVNISSFFIKKGTIPLDLGCTTGKLLDHLTDRYNVNGIGFDISDVQFKSTKNNLIKQDITDEDFNIPNTSLILSVFTVQFLPENSKPILLSKIYNSLCVGGAFIFCEKEISLNGQVQECFTFSNYQNKLNNFTADEILAKEVQLRHSMTCGNAKTNEALLKRAGFKVIEPFFQSLNFKGYLCIK